jgi:hypothetical protein
MSMLRAGWPGRWRLSSREPDCLPGKGSQGGRVSGDETLIAILAAAAAIPVGLGAWCAWTLRSARYGWLLLLCGLACGVSVHAFYEILVLNMYPVFLPLVLYPAGWLGAAIIAARGYLRLRRQRQRRAGAPGR